MVNRVPNGDDVAFKVQGSNLNSLEELISFIIIGKVESGEPVIRFEEMEETLRLYSLVVEILPFHEQNYFFSREKVKIDWLDRSDKLERHVIFRGKTSAPMTGLTTQSDT